MQEIKIRKRVPVNIRQFLFERFERDGETLSKTKHYGFVYLAEIGHNDVPVFIISKDGLGLGEQELALRPCMDSEMTSDKERDVVLTEDAFLKKMVEKEYKSKFALWAKNKEMQGYTDDPPTFSKVFSDVCTKYGCIAYYTTTPVEIEDLQKFSKEEVEEVFDDYIRQGWEISPEIYEIMRAGLVQFRADAANQKLMKYRGHCLIIKSPKSGVSTISTRIGMNIDHISTKSIEGHATADGEIQHSSLHNVWGHVNIDEFLEMPENLLQHMFNYLELGAFNTHKASRVIKNYGAPRICFTANPQDVAGIEFSKILGGSAIEIEDVNGQVSFARDEGKEKLMYTVFKQSLNQLTKVSNAAFSRLGVVLFAPSLMAARRTDKAGDVAHFEKVTCIAESIVENLREPTTKIFMDSEPWLNQPLPDYEKQIDEFLKGTTQTDVKNAWAGQKDAYKHIRGHALAEAIVEHASSILTGNYSLEEIQDTAEDNVKYVCEMNLHSLKNIILAVDRYENDEDVLAVGLANVRPSYVRAILYSYLYAIQGKQDGEVVTFEYLKAIFEQIDRPKREPLGRDVCWSRFEKMVNRNKVKRTLNSLNLTPLLTNCNDFVVKSELSVRLASSFVKIGLEIPQNYNVTKITKKSGTETGGVVNAG